VNLDSWLQTIQSLHPTEIELGLERIRTAAARLGLQRPAPWVITVAGTNGKGSCVAVTEAVLLRAGYRTGAYTSPHIHRYNERLRIDGVDIDDESLCRAFEKVAAARGDVSLTYFEFGTLAALVIMAETSLDVAILEVGLGGRLDAVNIIDADVAIISQLGLDHQEWLGPDLDSIGREKAGIMRSGRPVVCGDRELPASVIRHAADISAVLLQQERQFGWQAAQQGHWHWWGQGADGRECRLDNLPACRLHRDNCAAALQALNLLPLNLPEIAIREAIAGVSVPGRFEVRSDPATGRRVIFDVGHNPSAAALISRNLHALGQQSAQAPKVAAVLAMMADKDVRGFLGNLESRVDIWYIAGVDQPRAMAVEKLAALLDDCGLRRSARLYADPQEAYRDAVTAGGIDLVLVTGSFFTVAAVRGAITTGDAG
jgi:dihydrofolate synthase/folylpolyglutamate synthase